MKKRLPENEKETKEEEDDDEEENKTKQNKKRLNSNFIYLLHLFKPCVLYCSPSSKWQRSF